MKTFCTKRDFLLLSSSLMVTSTQQTLALSSSSSPSVSSDYAVVGCGVLGTSLCKQLLDSPVFGSRVVTGITKSTTRHEDILSEVLGTTESKRMNVDTFDSIRAQNKKFKDIVFCAPPSGFEDYPKALEDCIMNLWEGPENGGSFIFTSSGAVYAGKDGETVTESCDTVNPEDNPRSARLIYAEEKCLKNGGTVIRLAGLYNLNRGAHNYWLVNSGGKVKGRADGIINQLHYDDAANICLTASLLSSSSSSNDKIESISGKIFLASDGNPMTRKQICESALKAKYYQSKGYEVPEFLGGEQDDLGKVYDGSYTNQMLNNWKPKFASSFDEFMINN